jgi:hypothetical protein
MRNVIPNAFRRGGFAVAVTVALLAAQAIGLAHRLDVADHEAGQACEVCLAASVFGGANVGAVTSLTAVKALQAVDSELRPLLVSRTPRHFRARAPPLAS